jgi:hypothetical protein
MRNIANNCYISLPEALEGQPIDSDTQHIEASHNSNIDDEEAIFANDTSEQKIMLLQEPSQAHRPIS